MNDMMTNFLEALKNAARRNAIEVEELPEELKIEVQEKDDEE